MKNTHWLLIVAALLLATSTTTPVYAQNKGQDKGWYVGLGLNHSNDEGLDDEESDFKLFGGYQFNQYVALEGALVGLGTSLGASDLTKDGLAVQVVGTLPVGKRFKLFAKVGFFAWEVRVDTDEFDCFEFSGGFACFEEEQDVVDDGTDPAYGVGIEYRLGERWGMRSEWERFEDVGDSDIDLVSVSVAFRF